MVPPHSEIIIRGLNEESLAVAIIDYYIEVWVKRKKESQNIVRSFYDMKKARNLF